MANQIMFVCTADGCPNKDITYIWETLEQETAMCGGCGEILEAQNA